MGSTDCRALGLRCLHGVLTFADPIRLSPGFIPNPKASKYALPSSIASSPSKIGAESQMSKSNTGRAVAGESSQRALDRGQRLAAWLHDEAAAYSTFSLRRIWEGLWDLLVGP